MKDEDGNLDNELDTKPDEIPPAETAGRPAKSIWWARAVDLLETLVLAVLLFLAINAISARIRVDGFSMEPTLHSGELVIVSKLHYLLGEPQRQDVIVFHLPQDPEQEYIKRVIGLAGDRVVIQNGQVQVNDQLLEEPYVAADPVYEGSWTVPEGDLFVLGDNRNNSSDSHQWGPVPLEYVVGKGLLVYWPLNRIRLINTH